MGVARLPQKSYFQPFLFLELGRHIGVLPLLGLGASLIIVAYCRPVWLSWSQIEHGRSLRWLITLIALPLAWSFISYDYNLYFNQGYYLDRLFAFCFLLLLYWRPVFVFPFLLILIPLCWQLNYPLRGYISTEHFIFVRVLLLFFSAFFIHILTGRRTMSLFVFMALTFVAAQYFSPGLGKVWIGWITHGHLFHLLFATYANGWLGFLAPETLTSLAWIFT